MPRWHVCHTHTSVQSDAHEYSRAFGPGCRVDFDDAVMAGVVLGDLVSARCFTPVEEAHSPAARRTLRPALNVVPPAETPSAPQE